MERSSHFAPAVLSFSSNFPSYLAGIDRSRMRSVNDESPEPLFSPNCPPQLRDVRTAAEFKFVRVIGQGPLTRVYYAKHLASGFKCAIKIYYKKLLTKKDVKQILRETELHLHVHHANVIDLYLALFDENAFYLVMSYAERGDLFREMQRFEAGKMPEETAATCVLQPLVAALVYMHSQGIAQ